jgi:hypothetical protein
MMRLMVQNFLGKGKPAALDALFLFFASPEAALAELEEAIIGYAASLRKGPNRVRLAGLGVRQGIDSHQRLRRRL